MTRLLPALLLAAVASTAAADDITLTRPLAGATLNDRRVDLTAYWTGTDDGVLVSAVYRPRGDETDPSRLMLLLNDGDTVRFGLPDLPGTMYEFARRNDAVTVTSSPTWIDVAQN